MPTSSTTDESESNECQICGRVPSYCENTGMIRYEVPLEDPRFGKLFRCPHNSKSLDENRKNKLRVLSNLDAYGDKRFDNFNLQVPLLTPREGESLEMAYKLALRFAEKPEGWLLLEGTYGCGKTHLAAAIGSERLEHGDFVIFVTAPDLLDHLRNAYSPGADAGYDETFDRLRNAELLILDDLGVENPSAWAKEKLFQLLNHRYSYNLPTVITTNMDIDRIDPRIRSRLLHTEFTHRAKITAPDYRSAIGNENDQLMSNLTLYREMTFESFVLENTLYPKERENLERALESAINFAENPQGWLVFMGNYGAGKTHLAAAIANHLQHNNTKIMFITVPDLMDYLRVTYDPDVGSSFDQRFQAVRQTELLVLDDLGTENATSWAKEKLFQILDYRYVARLPTIITTARQIDDLNDRVSSRILDDRRSRIFAITAPSYAVRRRRK